MVEIKSNLPEPAPALPCDSDEMPLSTPLKPATSGSVGGHCLDFEFSLSQLQSPLQLSTQPNTPDVCHLTNKKVHSCEICLKIYSRSGTLKVHMRKHTGERPFECGVCGKRFAEKGNLHTHERIHSGLKPYTCKECSRSFTTQGHLTDHARKHTGDRPFVCSTCQMSFMRSSTLKIHSRTHTGDRPYACPHCDKAFTESGNLRTHIRTHVLLTQTGERPFVCPFEDCGKAFKTRGHLQDHMQKTRVHRLKENINPLS